ncbi:hypothetical protein [Nitrosopumilus piranensis]|uniref:Uncharacterized protein n=1 Tax=Nitrosopumilus piranensis TaxID=1582439 RepID=A0A0C5BXP3_9ARCH|nr:hypothetical protein [Nitrosopumilus piranensis]AJM91750.1 hypothetical protein NPIRD3C_0536 [Nitrosopumilus piranensis]
MCKNGDGNFALKNGTLNHEGLSFDAITGLEYIMENESVAFKTF